MIYLSLNPLLGNARIEIQGQNFVSKEYSVDELIIRSGCLEEPIVLVAIFTWVNSDEISYSSSLADCLSDNFFKFKASSIEEAFSKCSVLRILG